MKAELVNAATYYTTREHLGGDSLVMLFPNNYGVSVIRNPYSYGGPEGLWELAVIKGTPEEWQITYDTPIASDVIGHLTEGEVEEYARQVAKL